MIGPYRILNLIGRGGMGAVYRAFDKGLDRIVAIKTMHSAKVGSQRRARLVREGRALARVRHRNIVSVHCLEMCDGLPVLVMEHVPGLDLRRNMERVAQIVVAMERIGEGAGNRPLDAVRWSCECCRVVIGVAEALCHLHESGIVHRDVKPENVLLDCSTGDVRLVDFGLVRWGEREGLTRTSVALGTWEYMSPEQLRCPPAAPDPKSDQYSLGLVLHELLMFGVDAEVRRVPRAAGRKPGAASKSLRRGSPGLPENVRSVCMRSLNDDSLGRWRTMREFADELQGCLVELQGSWEAPPAGVVKSTQRGWTTQADVSAWVRELYAEAMVEETERSWVFKFLGCTVYFICHSDVDWVRAKIAVPQERARTATKFVEASCRGIDVEENLRFVFAQGQLWATFTSPLRSLTEADLGRGLRGIVRLSMWRGGDPPLSLEE
ncbi:MAG: serine/threonine-protein kinase [Planctomycetota bacterium]